jgi:NAD(P)-dependent dehydrogenase (short-subunit alcohol dehydrogenase family)
MTETNLHGKTIVITGATSGIGRAAATALAAEGAVVIGVGRSAEKCRSLEAEIRGRRPAAEIHTLTADLASLRQVRRLAGDVLALLAGMGTGKLDALVNNAGLVATWYTATEDGYELQFAVNHLAPFLLTHELMPALRRADGARILTTSSGSHRGANINWGDPMHRRRYHILAAYGQSKLANVLFTAEFNRRIGAAAGIRACAVDPGLVDTEIGLKGTVGIERWVWQWRRRGGAAPEEAAKTIVHLAGQAALPAPDAIYWKDCRPLAPSRAALNAADAARLWTLSEQLCGAPWSEPGGTGCLPNQC